ncbi:DUF998 domain-containing protein [Microbacterium nymphoidis]|uniref:DUF998 domain-containing protein n=1 Tax=Microbacterium nymphoidis TaxID=2898586 RepID=UPI001E48BF90|nr:DUF998 domain-containing protein [Microbacterium nymphoidis]MCD2500098.1 DUF998 domain-containing protein [Microbacterium nymphoidis]
MRVHDSRELPAPSPAVPPLLRAAGILWVLAPLWYLLCEAVAAAAFPGYDYARFYISDLGVPEHAEFQGRMLESSLPAVMNAGFIGTGLFFLLGAILVISWLGLRGPGIAFLILAAVHTAGIVFVGLVPGSPTNARLGWITIHALGAVAAIGAGNAAAIVSRWALAPAGLSRRTLWVGPVLGFAGFVSAVLLSLHAGLPDGVWERGAVYAFLLWQLLAGLMLLRAASSPAPR